jgi:hypothetical protein
MESELKQAGQYQPDPECFDIGIWDVPSETARVRRMDATEWTLVSSHSQLNVETTQNLSVVGLGFTYPQRRQPYIFGTLIYKELAARWTPVSQSSDWILYHNNQFKPSAAGS